MHRKLSVLFLLATSAWLLSVGGTLDVSFPSVPSIGNIVNGITNRTLGVIKDGINFFSSSIDRIINTFNRVEDRLRELLIEVSKYLESGIPEFNIPILDPLRIERIDFDIVHEAATLKGNVRNVTVRRISKFIIDDLQFKDLGNWLFRLDLNLTFPLLLIDGKYKVNGLIGDTFKIFGDGNFWLKVSNFSIGTSTLLKFESIRPRVVGMNIDVKLRKLQNKFENLMNDEEVGALFNKAISKMAPEAVDILWPELKQPIQKKVIKLVNNVLENTTVANVVRRLLNIGFN